ncbi:hypothetical protein AWC03_05090 [Mycobacterium europaeum]|nr:hypothetical protein AWC03_05090 [Mycobacterium europaeum]
MTTAMIPRMTAPNTKMTETKTVSQLLPGETGGHWPDSHKGTLRKMKISIAESSATIAITRDAMPSRFFLGPRGRGGG